MVGFEVLFGGESRLDISHMKRYLANSKYLPIVFKADSFVESISLVYLTDSANERCRTR